MFLLDCIWDLVIMINLTLTDIMQQFDHQHIIKLVGICSADSGPVWIVMELARHGELRAYLLENHSRLSLSTLVCLWPTHIQEVNSLSKFLSFCFPNSVFVMEVL